MSRPTIESLQGRCDIDPTTGCWRWRSPLTAAGYGQIGVKWKKYYVHRLAYELAVGPIPEGYEIDHLCRVRACMNPEHLEAVTPYENNMRSDSLAARRARMTHCPRGHEFTPDNIYSRPDRKNSRMCRTCCQLREARRQRRAS